MRLPMRPEKAPDNDEQIYAHIASSLLLLLRRRRRRFASCADAVLRWRKRRRRPTDIAAVQVYVLCWLTGSGL